MKYVITIDGEGDKWSTTVEEHGNAVMVHGFQCNSRTMALQVAKEEINILLIRGERKVTG